MRRTIFLALSLSAAIAVLAGCESTSTTKQASMPTPTAPPLPPPIQEAPAPYRAQLHMAPRGVELEGNMVDVTEDEVLALPSLECLGSARKIVYGIGRFSGPSLARVSSATSRTMDI